MTIHFSDLGLRDDLVATLRSQGLHEPFPIQRAAIPDTLEGRDISGKAPTGSGKTLAFGLPILSRLAKAKPHRPTALVLAPTRELAEQISGDLEPYAATVSRRVYAVYGGVSYRPQLNAFRKGVDLLVATPGRLEDLIQQKVVDLGSVAVAVIDEADRLADMGFLPDVRRLLDRTPTARQTLLYSATLDGDVAVLSRDYQRNPASHETEAVAPDLDGVDHRFWLVKHQERVQYAADLVTAAGTSIVFTRTRHGADRLAKQLNALGVMSVAIHGGRSQNQRRRALATFAGGKAQALIATDVAARGIHIDAVAAVLHFDPPQQAKDYVHRSGRTARAGAGGTVVSLVTKGQRPAAARMLKRLNIDAPIAAPRPEALMEIAGRAPAPAPRASDRPDVPPHRAHAAASTGTDRRRSPRKAPGAHKPESIYVANLPWSATEADVRALFKRFGRVHDVTVITDRRSGRSKGFGFVDMAGGAARTAIKKLDGSRLKGRDLTVRFVRPRRFGG